MLVSHGGGILTLGVDGFPIPGSAGNLLKVLVGAGDNRLDSGPHCSYHPAVSMSMSDGGHDGRAGTRTSGNRRVCCQQDLEGIVIKAARGPYNEAPRGWLKVINPNYSQHRGRREMFVDCNHGGIGWNGRSLDGELKMAIPTEMDRRVADVLYVVAMVAVIVGVDFVFFKNRLWERLTVNIGIVVVFAAFYLRFLRRP
jgi:hypothetical protein